MKEKCDGCEHNRHEYGCAIDRCPLRPTIDVDKEAIRFSHSNGGFNLFWRDLFLGGRRDFRSEVMEALKVVYDECIRLDVEPDVEEEA